MFEIKKRTNLELEVIELEKVITDSFSHFEKCDFGWMAEWKGNENDILLMYNDKIVGFHFFEENSIVFNSHTNIKWLEDIKKYKNKRKLQGTIMGVLPEYAKMGGASLMIEYEKKVLGKKYDYIWGGHKKYLNNIDFWLKSRRIVGENCNSYYTLMDLK